MQDPVRFAFFVTWGLASTAVWGWVVLGAVQRWHVHRDRRSKRELLRDGALFLTAFGSVCALVGALFGESGTTPRAVAFAIALGMFLAAGIVSASLRKGAV